MTEHASPTPPSASALRILAVFAAIGAAVAFFLLGTAPKQTTLVVDVSPVGATVRVLKPALAGAEKVASAGQVRFEGLAAGHRLRLTASAPGYQQAIVDEVLPREGGEHRIAVKLASETALYTVQSEPPGAMIYLDSRAIGVSPAVLDNVAPGAHTVEAHLDGYETGKLEFTAVSGEHKQLLVTLTALPEVAGDAGAPAVAEEEPPPGYGRLVVESTHAAHFFYNNAVLGLGTRVARMVPAGRHRVTARAEGRGTKWEMVDVEDQGRHVVRFEFTEDPMQRAFEATDPNKPIYWIVRGGNTRNEGKYGDSVEYFKKALELDPEPADEIEIHRQLSRTLPALKRWDEAIEHAEKYLELAPESPDAKFTRELLDEMKRRKAEDKTR